MAASSWSIHGRLGGRGGGGGGGGGGELVPSASDGGGSGVEMGRESYGLHWESFGETDLYKEWWNMKVKKSCWNMKVKKECWNTKVLEEGRDANTAHYTHFRPHNTLHVTTCTYMLHVLIATA